MPGLGLLRDGQKWLAPFVVVAVLSVGVAADAALRGARRRAPVLAPSAVAVALVLPFVLLPDATVVVHRVLAPSRYPADYRAVAAAVDGTEGALVSAPWRLYRRYPWATGYPTYDPASRWFDVRVVTSDELGVGESTIGGEDPYAARIGALITSPGPDTAVDLATAGVRWVLVTRTDPDADDVLAALGPGSGAVRVVDGPDLVLVELAAPSEPRRPSRRGGGPSWSEPTSRCSPSSSSCRCRGHAARGPDLCYSCVVFDRRVPMFANVLAPLLAGIILAIGAMFGLVSARTAAPAENPASQPIIVYGQR